jgi:uncharacterized protein YkwD
MREANWSLVLCCLLAGCGGSGAILTCTPGPNPASVGAPTGAEGSEAMSIGTRINAYRATLPGPPEPMAWDATAAQIAYDHAADMQGRGFFDGVNPNCWSVADRAADVGLTYVEIVEFIAMRKQSAQEMFDAWFATAGVRAAMAREDLIRIGVGKREGPGGPWWTMVLYEPVPP